MMGLRTGREVVEGCASDVTVVVIGSTGRGGRRDCPCQMSEYQFF